MIKEYAKSGRTLIGICLGFQLLFDRNAKNLVFLKDCLFSMVK